MKKTFKIGGIHPPQFKTTDASRIITVDAPQSVTLPLLQRMGRPAIPIVQKGDTVSIGQKIAEADGALSSPVHASISGTVTAIDTVMLAAGGRVQAITITRGDEPQTPFETIARDYRQLTPEEIIRLIADAGIVGLGGAMFPTSIKLCPPPQYKAEVLIINAAECEPYLTCDDALMRARAPQIITGIEILMRAARVDSAIVGIEDNKPEAYTALVEAAKGRSIEIQQLVTKYPQGGEKQLIQALIGKEVPSGALPIATGAIVQNVATAYAVYQAVALGMPLIERVVTISGSGNYLVPIGMNIADIPGVIIPSDDPEDPTYTMDVVLGGPMMGFSAVNLNAPVTKGFSGISYLWPADYDPRQLYYEPKPCVRCGECVRACPMGLEPYLLQAYGEHRLFGEAIAAGARDCIECGSCNYSCPSGRPILQFIKFSKIKAK